MTASLRAGRVVTLPTVGLFADGAAVKTVGAETFNVCHQLVDEMITVQTGWIDGLLYDLLNSLCFICFSSFFFSICLFS